MTYKPTFDSVRLADGLKWRGGNGWRYEEKLDGQLHVEELPHATAVIGELMRGGQFFAFDVLNYNGQDLRSLPLSERLMVLDGMNLPRPWAGAWGRAGRCGAARGGCVQGPRRSG